MLLTQPAALGRFSFRYKDTAPLDVAPAVPPAVDELPRFHMLWPSVFHPHEVDSKSQFTASANNSRVPL